MKVILLFFSLINFPFFCTADKIIPLKGLLKPNSMAVSNNFIYVVEAPNIWIYSNKDYQLLGKFGKEGEGPREFKVLPFGAPMRITPYENSILVNSNAKLSYFTENGQYLKEIKIPSFTFFRPVDNSFVAVGNSVNENNKSVLSIQLYNNKLEKLKTLYFSDASIDPSAQLIFPFTPLAFSVHKENIYIASQIKDGFSIDIYDQNGKEVKRIKKICQPLIVTPEYKEKTLQWFQKDPIFKFYWEGFKNRISFKKNFPPVQTMEITGDKIYILTYNKQNEDTECIVLNLNCNEQKRSFIFYPTTYGFDNSCLYAFNKNSFYTIVENIDNETWELHIQNI